MLFKLKRQLKAAFDKIKREFSEHLDAINANTNEIQGNYEQLCELENKVDKLTERVDEIHMLLVKAFSKSKQPEIPKTRFDIAPLTSREKEVFLILYDLEEKSCTTYEEIAQRYGKQTSLIISYIASLTAKGIPIQKRYVNNIVELSLSPEFKQCQAKLNILEISGEICRKVRDHAQ